MAKPKLTKDEIFYVDSRTHASLRGLLGRYEFHDNNANSHKFWTISYDSKNGSYIRTWGRIGADGQSQNDLTGVGALKLIQEKISKGYRKVEDEIPERKALRERAERLKDRKKKEEEAIDVMAEIKKL